MDPCVWLIAGPTASGKTELAARWAERVGGEVVNADSMQVYRGLEILSAAPDACVRARAPHHLFGVAPPHERYSVGRWLRDARRVLADVSRRGVPAVVVGGTGLYFRALTEGLAETPDVPEAVREEARALFRDLGETAFRGRLAALDPDAAERLARGDRARLLRAYEVARSSGAPIGVWRAAGAVGLSPQLYRAVVLDPPRAVLRERVERRFDRMMDQGALAEVAALLAEPLPEDAPVLKALGAPELRAVLEGRQDLASAVTAAKAATRRYLKRQSTWFRHQAPLWPRVRDVDPEAAFQSLAAAFAGPPTAPRPPGAAPPLTAPSEVGERGE